MRDSQVPCKQNLSEVEVSPLYKSTFEIDLLTLEGWAILYSLTIVVIKDVVKIRIIVDKVKANFDQDVLLKKLWQIKVNNSRFAEEVIEDNGQ